MTNASFGCGPDGLVVSEKFNDSVELERVVVEFKMVVAELGRVFEVESVVTEFERVVVKFVVIEFLRGELREMR